MSQVAIEVFFSAVDSLYFRGSRPHSAAGASTLPSEFPPSSSTLSGAVRTRLGDALNIRWDEIKELEGKAQTTQEFSGINLGELIGSSRDTGLLSFSESRLYKNKERLYPVPAVLLQTGEGQIVRLELGKAVHCDLGIVRLPQLPKDIANAKPLENAWLTEAGLKLFIEGKLPKAEHIIHASDIYSHESRLGIGRDVSLGTVKSGLLYQTEHLRLSDGVEFAIEVLMPEAVAQPFMSDVERSSLQRFGGEGRMAYLRTQEVETATKVSEIKQPNLLMLLTDMLQHSDFADTPIAGLSRTQHNDIDCWEGELHGVPVRLHAVVSGKTKRFGGWDIRHNRPRDVQSYIPAGSCFFVEALNSASLAQLTGSQIGRRIDFGFGTLLCAQ